MPENAIDRLARALDRLARHHEPPRLLPVTRAYFAARAAVEPPAIAAAMRAVAGAKGKLPPKALAILERDPLLAARLRTTCVATTVRGGTRENALPADAVANVNCRILPDETVDQRRSVLARIIDDPAVEIRVVESFGSGPPSPIDGSVPVAIAQVVHEMWPGIPIIPTMSLGATDSRFLRNAGTAAYGFNPIALTEPDARRAHGIDERIPVASLLTAVELFHRLVLRLAAGEAPAMPSALGGQSPIAAPAGRRRSFAP